MGGTKNHFQSESIMELWPFWSSSLPSGQSGFLLGPSSVNAMVIICGLNVIEWIIYGLYVIILWLYVDWHGIESGVFWVQFLVFAEIFSISYDNGDVSSLSPCLFLLHQYSQVRDESSLTTVIPFTRFRGFHSHGGTPKVGWFISWNLHQKKWIRTGGTPISGWGPIYTLW
jgi:hypothetical protein